MTTSFAASEPVCEGKARFARSAATSADIPDILSFGWSQELSPNSTNFGSDPLISPVNLVDSFVGG